jgi:hypothetical protein
MEKIYIRKKNQVISGPYQISNLRTAGLNSSDKVWYEGLATWTPVSQVDFLRRSAVKGSLFKRMFGR